LPRQFAGRSVKGSEGKGRDVNDIPAGSCIALYLITLRNVSRCTSWAVASTKGMYRVMNVKDEHHPREQTSLKAIQ
jgi:hypothetical protein